MKVWALTPPFLKKFSRASRSPAVTKSGTIYYPTWLAYATGSLEKAGHEVMLIDAPARGLELADMEGRIQDFSPGLVLIDTATGSFHHDVKVAEHLRKLRPKCLMWMVGTHVSGLPDQVLGQHPYIDGVCRREYDVTAVHLANSLQDAAPLSEVTGLSFRSAEGRVIHNVDRP